MDNRWTLHVEDFGKIEYADVTVAPLTLFVGDNNSGKSYLMTLLYALLCMDFRDLDLCEDLDEYQKCADWLFKATHDILVLYPLEGEILSLLTALLNRILERNKGKLSEEVFNRTVNIEKISISFQYGMEKSLVMGNVLHDDDGRPYLHIFFDGGNEENYFSCDAADDDISPRDTHYAIAYILENIIGGESFSKIFSHEDVAFLPISRTGFLLTYPPLAYDAFQAYTPTAGTNRRLPKVHLVKPCSDFLRTIATINKRNEQEEDELYLSVVRFVETQMIYGKIYVSNDLPMPAFSYRPNQTMETDFPMFLSSGVVTELAPLLLLLQYTPVRTFFIEEPEMSLHPELQQKMARVLIRLANQNMPVFATTHSNTIIQHVNNMVKLSYLPEETQTEIMARFGFERSDLISDADISMCQFDIQENGRTMVSTLSSDFCSHVQGRAEKYAGSGPCDETAGMRKQR